MLKSEQYTRVLCIQTSCFSFVRRGWLCSCCLSGSPAVLPGQQVCTALPVSQLNTAHSSLPPSGAERSWYPVIHWVFDFQWRGLCVRWVMGRKMTGLMVKCSAMVKKSVHTVWNDQNYVQKMESWRIFLSPQISLRQIWPNYRNPNSSSTIWRCNGHYARF